MSESPDEVVIITERHPVVRYILYTVVSLVLIGLVGYFFYAAMRSVPVAEVPVEEEVVQQYTLKRFSDTESYNEYALEFEVMTPNYLQNPMAEVDFKVPRLTEAQLSEEVLALLEMQRVGSVLDPEGLKKYLANPLNAPLLRNRSVGETFRAETNPDTVMLLHKVLADTNVFTSALKRFYDRARPHVYDERISRVVEDVVAEPATPNRLAMQLFVLAEVLGEVLEGSSVGVTESTPETVTVVEIRQAARQLLPDVQFAGLALESDIESAELAARLFVARLRTNEQYQQDLAAAREEMLAAAGN
jgi:hypothetical protein